MLILTRADVERLLDLDALVDRLEQAMVDLSAGRASVPPRIGAQSKSSTSASAVDSTCPALVAPPIA